MFLNALILALSASIDSLGVGITYGLKKTQINFPAFLVLFILSIIITTISMFLGNTLSSIISPDVTSILGSIILFFIGFFIIYEAGLKKSDAKIDNRTDILKSKKYKQNIELKNKDKENIDFKKENRKNIDLRKVKSNGFISKHKEYNIFIKCLGITINIIKDPINSDIDNSNKIDIKEALFLGTALSLDSVSIGFGASIIGINTILFPLLASIFQIIFLNLGKFLGEKINNIAFLPKNIWNIISGILLICIGAYKLFMILFS